jgi:short-subunit dehydrogenase
MSAEAGLTRLIDLIGERPIEILAHNAGFGANGKFAEADAVHT